MKRNFTFRTLLVAFTLLLGGGTSWGDEAGTVTATLDHTASSSRDQANTITTTVDAAAEHYNNTKAAAWGGWAYAQFSFSIPSNESIVSATLTWSTKIIGKNYMRANDIYYVKAGKTIDYTISSSTSLNLTGDATFITSVSLMGGQDHKNVSTDVTEAVRAIAASQNYIIFEWTNNPAGADLYGKASDYAPVLVIETTTETLYRVTFTETNGVEATVTIDDNDVTSGTSLGNGNYSFVAKAKGYYDYEGTFEISGEDKEVQFTMTEKPTFTYTVNAVDENGELLQSSIASATHYEGETGNVTWSKYIKVGDSWYVTDETPFVTTATSSGEKNVVYKPSNIFYFVECEKMNGVRTDRDATEEGGSNNVYIRLSSYSKNYYTDFFAEGGVFDMDIPYYNSNSGAEEYKIQTYDGSTYTDTGLTLSCAAKGSGSMSQKGIVVPAGSAIAITYSGTGNALARMDYLTLTRVTVSQTIGNAEWATLYTPMALNFAGTGLKAYTATVSNNVVTLTQVNDVPANTGVVLNGTPDDYTIPAIASSTTDKGELQGSLNSALTYDANAANDYYMLALNGKKVQFTKLISGSIAAGKAYLVLPKDPTTGARTLTVAFSEGGTTGIKQIENGELTIDNYYNLNGQRVSKPTKGLYIVNGKKVVLK